MKLITCARIASALVLAASCGTALGQELNKSLATNTGYSLLATDSVAFGPGIQKFARKELLFKVSPISEENASTDGGNKRSWSGDLAFDRIDFLSASEVRMEDPSDGLSYTAGVEIENTDEFDSQSEIISSRQLGIHYGRLGSDDYRAVSLSFRDFNIDSADDNAEDPDELWSLGVTTGRRFALTGLDASDPLWTVSLRGQFNVLESDDIDEALDNQQWYVSPGLHWSRESFNLTADVLMPFIKSGELEEDSDYRIRAKIQKRF